jgi:hypothetical protein
MTWTEDRRNKQRELIQIWRPWEKSTGARTIAGKARVSKNAVKTEKSKELRELFKNLNRLLKRQKDLIRWVIEEKL